jgi:hypothetical protein
MRVPIYLQTAQWALLLGLGCLLVVLYRQLGRLAGRRAEERAELGPPVGSIAAPFRYERLPDGTAGRMSPGGGQPALIAFVDPTCPACEQLVTSLGQLAATGELAGARILLLVSDPPGYLRISPAFQATSLEIGRPASAAEVAGYRAAGTPLLVAVDAGGVVRAAGVASRPAEVMTFARSMTGSHDLVLHDLGRDDLGRPDRQRPAPPALWVPAPTGAGRNAPGAESEVLP